MQTNIGNQYKQTPGPKGRAVQTTPHHSQGTQHCLLFLMCLTAFYFLCFHWNGSLWRNSPTWLWTGSEQQQDLAGTALWNNSETSRQRDKQPKKKKKERKKRKKKIPQKCVLRGKSCESKTITRNASMSLQKKTNLILFVLPLPDY